MRLNRIIELITRFFTDSYRRFMYLSQLGFYNWKSDEEYLKKQYKLKMGKSLNLESPKMYNEKLQWLKVNDHNPAYTILVDKYEVKNYVANLIGEEYIIPTLGVWDRFDDIDFSKLPNQFVLKCTHDSGGLVIVKDKARMNFKQARRIINKSLHRNFYYAAREWPYKNVKPRIIAEKYMTEHGGEGLKDYKIFNFSGEPKLIQVDYDRFIDHKRNLYSVNWEYVNASIEYPTNSDIIIERPIQLELMLDLARKLSKGFIHLRTDFYCVNDKVYFGELTFYHEAGYGKFEPEEFEYQMGEYIQLPIEG